jgi:hypothetical protein
MGIQVYLRISKRRRELFKAVRRTSLGELVREVLCVEGGTHSSMLASRLSEYPLNCVGILKSSNTAWYATAIGVTT